MRSLFTRVVAVVVFLPWSAAAQSLSLTEEEALARLGPDNPRMQAARAGVEVARADVLAAGRWPNPRVTYDRESVAGVTEHLTMVAQVLPLTGGRRLAVNAASARVDAAASRASERVRQLGLDLRDAFATLWAAQERERELTAAHARLMELAGVLARREAAGDAAGFDRLRAEREALDVESARDAAAAERAHAQAVLDGFISTTPGVPVAAVGRAPGRLPLPSLDELVSRAESTRGEFAALRHEIAAATFSERAAARLRLPEPEVVAGTKASNTGSGDVGSVLAVHVSVPLFDQGRPERTLALARAAQARAELSGLSSVLRASVAALRAVVLRRREAADRHRAAMNDMADTLERIARVSYDAGERGILELIDALRSASSARVRQIDLDLSVRRSELELERLSGWEIR
jgi:cobalt-zinc-cadmium efflux system outer membrane protein